jgi:bacterioferritin
MLNETLAEEWLAYYQYWIGARLVEGPMRSEIEPELLLHADQELGHAVLVVNRITQLGGTPLYFRSTTIVVLRFFEAILKLS